jgi:hypothetical protein
MQNITGSPELPARTHAEAAALFRRAFAPGAIGFRRQAPVHGLPADCHPAGQRPWRRRRRRLRGRGGDGRRLARRPESPLLRRAQARGRGDRHRRVPVHRARPGRAADRAEGPPSAADPPLRQARHADADSGHRAVAAPRLRAADEHRGGYAATSAKSSPAANPSAAWDKAKSPNSRTPRPSGTERFSPSATEGPYATGPQGGASAGDTSAPGNGVVAEFRGLGRDAA